jgi:hypothetical protein
MPRPPKTSKKAQNQVPTTVVPSPLPPLFRPLPTINFGEEPWAGSSPVILSATPTPPPVSALDPVLSHPRPLNDTGLASQQAPAADSSDDEEEKDRLVWTEEMLEQLVEVLYEVFDEGGAADNSFKKPTFVRAAGKVRRVYRGSQEVTQVKCKNKWADTKRKWAHWVFLSKQSGIGFNPDTELYEAPDYVWDSLNKSHPKIIWHKTHVMPFRDMISYILHDVQANGRGGLTLETPTPTDPRLTSIAPRQDLPNPPNNISARTPYNKSKKRVRNDASDEEGRTTPPKKIDLGVAISNLTREMERARKAKEGHLSNQERAIKLLETEYQNRLGMIAFIQACTFFKDEGNALTFVTLTNMEMRDRWLELELHTELLV